MSAIINDLERLRADDGSFLRSRPTAAMGLVATLDTVVPGSGKERIVAQMWCVSIAGEVVYGRARTQ